MAAWPEPALAEEADLAPPGGVCLLVLQRVHAGQGGAARQAFLATDRAAIEEAGGRLRGRLRPAADDLPVIAAIVRWPDAAVCVAGMSTYNSRLNVHAARAAERERLGFDLFGASDRFLMVSSLPFGTI